MFAKIIPYYIHVLTEILLYIFVLLCTCLLPFICLVKPFSSSICCFVFYCAKINKSIKKNNKYNDKRHEEEKRLWTIFHFFCHLIPLSFFFFCRHMYIYKIFEVGLISVLCATPSRSVADSYNIYCNTI